MEYQVRKANMEDLDEITAIFKKAVEGMNAKNIFQWDEVYPTRDVFEDDIKKQQMYLLMDGNGILSAFVINHDCDERYLSGDWAFDVSGAAILHRLCVNPFYQNIGIGKETIKRIEEMLTERGYDSIRLDTFSQNPIALRLYTSLNYKKVGEVHFRKGLFYLFEKPLR